MLSSKPAGLLAAGGSSGPAALLLVLFAVIGLALLAFCISAIVSIVRSPHLSSNGKATWVIVVLILQFFGPLIWFSLGRRQVAGG